MADNLTTDIASQPDQATKIAVMAAHMEHMKGDIKDNETANADLLKMVQKHYLQKSEFEAKFNPTRTVVYTMVSIIVSSFILALVAMVMGRI